MLFTIILLIYWKLLYIAVYIIHFNEIIIICRTQRLAQNRLMLIQYMNRIRQRSLNITQMKRFCNELDACIQLRWTFLAQTVRFIQIFVFFFFLFFFLICWLHNFWFIQFVDFFMRLLNTEWKRKEYCWKIVWKYEYIKYSLWLYWIRESETSWRCDGIMQNEYLSKCIECIALLKFTNILENMHFRDTYHIQS